MTPERWRAAGVLLLSGRRGGLPFDHRSVSGPSPCFHPSLTTPILQAPCGYVTTNQEGHPRRAPAMLRATCGGASSRSGLPAGAVSPERADAPSNGSTGARGRGVGAVGPSLGSWPPWPVSGRDNGSRRGSAPPPRVPQQRTSKPWPARLANIPMLTASGIHSEIPRTRDNARSSHRSIALADRRRYRSPDDRASATRHPRARRRYAKKPPSPR